MRIYEFKCHTCNTEFEELVRSEAETPVCPKCGAREVTRLISAVRSHASAPAQGAQTGCAPAGGFS